MGDTTAEAGEFGASPSRGFLDLRAGGADRKRHMVPRKGRRVLVVGLDGAGKTRLCAALAHPCDVRVAMSRSVPTDLELEVRPPAESDDVPRILHEVDDRWLVKRTDTAGAFPSSAAVAKLPPTTRVELYDVPGAAAYRVLWQPMAEGSMPLGADDTAAAAAAGPDAILFVVAAHDTTRVALAWAELVAVAGCAPTTPLVIVVARTREGDGPCMSVADVFKAAEDFAPLSRAEDAAWTAIPVDLRPLEERPGENCMYPFADLRRLALWLAAAGAPRG
jgi:hypothetical protein